jgi:Flp pilus assembly pilin Flp
MITYLKRVIPSEVRARVIDYVMITSMFAVFIISSLLLVGTKLSNEFVEVGNILQ